MSSDHLYDTPPAETANRYKPAPPAEREAAKRDYELAAENQRFYQTRRAAEYALATEVPTLAEAALGATALMRHADVPTAVVLPGLVDSAQLNPLIGAD